MFRPELYVGVDIGSETFTASIGKFEEKEGWRISAKPITLTFGKPLTNSIKRY
jgi:cell division ATPase FtsA